MTTDPTVLDDVHRLATAASLQHDLRVEALAALGSHATGGGQMTPWHAGTLYAYIGDLTDLVRALAQSTTSDQQPEREVA